MTARAFPAGHVWRAQGVARALGVSFTEAILEGRLTPAGLDDIFTRCSGCGAPGACARWLEENGEDAAAPPAFCRNTAGLAALAAAVEEAAEGAAADRQNPV